jgi:5-methylcytosine-specific restriction endonuclease McrA
MPSAALVACRTYPCPHKLRSGQPCPVHGRKPFEGAHTRHRKVPASLKSQVMREEDTCWICGGIGLDDDQPDHVRAVADGGPTVRDNLRRAHKACNLARGARLGRSRARASA